VQAVVRGIPTQLRYRVSFDGAGPTAAAWCFGDGIGVGMGLGLGWSLGDQEEETIITFDGGEDAEDKEGGDEEVRKKWEAVAAPTRRKRPVIQPPKLSKRPTRPPS